MADRSYIIEVLLQARDDMSSAFAKATAEMEGFNALLDKQKTKNKEAIDTNENYTQELNRRLTAEQRLEKQLRDSTLRSAESAQALLKLRDAQREVAKAEAENDPAKRAVALKQVVDAQKNLVDALEKAGVANKGLATIQANRISHEEALQARLEQTGKIEQANAKRAQQDYKDRIANERAWQSVSDAINKETERSRSSSIRRLAQLDAQDAKDRAARRRKDAADIAAEQRAQNQKLAEFTRITGQAHGPARTLARTDVSQTEEIRATRELANARALLIQRGHDQTIVDHALHTIRQDALRDYGHVNQAAREAARVARDEANAYKMVESAARRLESARKSSAKTGRPVDHDLENIGTTNVGQQAPNQGGWASILNVIKTAKNEFADLDTSTSGFTTHLRGAFGFAAITLIQPLIALLVGVAAAFASVASAAVAAGGAIGTVFLSGIAQGIPVLGVFAAAMQRLQNVFGLVSAGLAQQQQKFIAQYETAAQTAMGINQVVIAQHNLSDAQFAAAQSVQQVIYAQHSYSDALFSLRVAQQNVNVAELQLRETRQQATRQLQDLIFQETQARLAAEASSLAITNSQKALRAAIATGGDVQGAQLQLAQAQASHQQAVAQAQRAIQDAAPGSLARQGIQEQIVQGSRAVQQAQRAVVDSEYALRQAATGVVQAQRAVVDARFQVAQARAEVIQAQQAAQGYNLGTAAQLAYLRSQMSKTELALAGNITRILNLFRGANAYMRPITDAIIGAFLPLTTRIYQLLTDPRIFGALRSLATQIGTSIRTATRELTDNAAINGFINLIKAATQNIAPFTRIVIDFIKSAGSIANTAIPFVHQFLIFIGQIASSFASWAQSTRGQNWLKNFFDVAFRSLEAFIKLALSIGRLVLDIVGIGGGAQSGINVLKELQGWVDRTSSSIEHHGKVFKELHKLWAIAVPTVKVLGEVLGAVVKAFLDLATSRQGQNSFKALGDLTSHVLVPAFERFAREIGWVTTQILNFLNKHPALQKFLVEFIATAAALSIGFKAVGLVFGPLSAIIGLIPKLAGLIEALKIIWAALKAIDIEAVIAFLGPLAPIALVVAAIVGLAVVTGNFHNLLKTLAAPFIAAWNQIKGPLDNLGKQFLYFINGILAPLGVHVKNLKSLFHDVFADILFVVKTIFSAIGTLIGATIGNTLRVIGDVFKILGDLARGHFGAVVKDFEKLGKDIVRGIWDALTLLPRLILKIFIDMVDAILKFLGISSPSKKFHSIGQAMVDGMWNALKSLGQFAGKILGWIRDGVGAILGFMLGLGKTILRNLWNGIVDAAKTYFNFEKWLWTTIFNAVWGLLKDIESLGEKIVDAIVKGITKAPGKILDAIKGLIPGPVKSVISGAAGVGKDILGAIGLHTGGPVPGGYGGGDIISARLEPGEHVFTKEEVSAAGGHGAMFAIRSSLGGGGQGGPYGYAAGGAVIQTALGGNVSGPGRTTQGVTGQLGSTLYNIRQFAEQFGNDWDAMWVDIDKLTIDALTNIEKYFSDSFNKIQLGWSGLFDKIHSVLDDVWPQINKRIQDGLNTMLFNFDWTYTQADKDTFNAFWYIIHAASQALQAFGAKPVTAKLGENPQFLHVATGGFLGNVGERGKDAIHAVLGRGEAVLNYAHQALVEPAMQAFYGFGLGKMFQRTGAQHAGDGTTPGGFAAGGSTDVNFYGKPSNVSPYLVQLMALMEKTFPSLVVTSTRSGGHASGSYHYLGEAVDMAGDPSLMDRAAQWVMSSGLYKNLVEGIHNPNLSVKNGNQVPPSFWGASTWAEHLNHIHLAITHALGNVSGSVVQAGASIAAKLSQWNDIPLQHVSGDGALARLMNAGIAVVTNTANRFGQAQMGAAAGATDLGAPVTKSAGYANAVKWTQQAMQLAGVTGPQWLQMLLRQESRESSYNPNAINNTDINAQRGDPSRGILQTIGSTFRQYALPGFNKNIYDPISNIIAAIRYIIARYGGGNSDRALQTMIARGGGAYAEGGFIGNAVPIIAHAGEWVLNKAQQYKLGGWLGAAPASIAKALGFSGGPDSFAGGGVVGLQPTISSTGAIQDPASVEAAESFGFASQSVQIVNKAELSLLRMIRNMRKNGNDINKALNTYLDNLNQLAGDNGILSLAAQALDTYITQQQTLVSLNANGIQRVVQTIRVGRRVIRTITERLRITRPETALEVANRDLQSTQQIGQDLNRLQGQEVAALNTVQVQLQNFGKVTQANLAQYQRLVGFRRNLLNQIADTDSKIAQNAQDVIDKQQTAFQARLDQTLRGTGTIQFGAGGLTGAIGPQRFANLGNTLSKVGPQIALGIAQTAQTIAQTLGDPNKLRISDQAVAEASTRQRDAIQEAYNQAAQRAQKDPRWQKVADDLLSQLESATTAVVQAQAQALTDAMQAQDTKSQIQTAILDIRNRFAQVIIGFGDNFTGVAQQIQISRDRATTLQGQIGAYQGLLGQAQAQGNVQAVNDLTQKIQDLTAQVAEANLQTQQLITAYRQISVSILQTQTQASSGLFSAANSIAQTLGAIAGNQNLPNLIKYAREAGATLITQGQQAVQNIVAAINDPNGPFGAQQGQAGGLLNQLVGAFNQGPQAFATMLASIAPQLSSFEAGLPQDQLSLFQGLVQALIDNTTSQVQNTQQLQQLNATTNQQAFTSSAWTLFREAIFTGLGTLLPQYAMTVPSLDVGGVLTSNGLLYGHKNEVMVPAQVARGNFTGGHTYHNNFNIDHPVEVADPVLFGNQVAWRLAHDPNSR